MRDFIDVYFGDNEIQIERCAAAAAAAAAAADTRSSRARAPPLPNARSRSYSIATNYPKRTYDDPAVTLRDSGLHPQAVVFVQDLDA